MADNGRKAGSIVLSALMAWSLAPHPVYASPAVGGSAGASDGSVPAVSADLAPHFSSATRTLLAEKTDSSATLPSELASVTGQDGDRSVENAPAAGDPEATEAPVAADTTASDVSPVVDTATGADGADAAAGQDGAASDEDPSSSVADTAAETDAATLDNVTYVDADGAVQNASNVTPLSAVMTDAAAQHTLASGWYLVDADITQDKRILVPSGSDVHLILGDGHTLTANGGIDCPAGAALTVQGQSAGTGTLEARYSDANVGGAAIGGTNGNACGTVVIDGGTVNATASGKGGPGIGGYGAKGGSVTINGGTVTAAGGGNNAGPGIGTSGTRGAALDSITINGGTVTATGGPTTGTAGSAGIGPAASAITITGGDVTAYGTGPSHAPGGAGIATGPSFGKVSIMGGTVNATGGPNAAAIGASHDSGGSISISGSTTTVNATAGAGAAAIGGGVIGRSGVISITDGAHVNAKAAAEGIGGTGDAGSTDSITIDNSFVRVTGTDPSASASAGIGAKGKTPVSITGSSVVFADGPIAQAQQSTWQGLVGQGGTQAASSSKDAKLYGTTVKPSQGFEVPAGFNVNIEEGKTLRVDGVAMDNQGAVNVSGTLDYTNGTINNSGTILKKGNGRIVPEAALTVAAQKSTDVYGDAVVLSTNVTDNRGVPGTVEFFVNGKSVGSREVNGPGTVSLDTKATDWRTGNNSVYAVFTGTPGNAATGTGNSWVTGTSPTVTYTLQIAGVTGLAWGEGDEGSTVATFDPVAAAASYTVHVTGSNGAPSADVTVRAADVRPQPDGKVAVDLSDAMKQAGTYVFRVRANTSGTASSQYSANSEPVHSVTFDANDGNASNVGMWFVENGHDAPTPQPLERAGWTFDGWHRGAASKEAWNFSTDKVDAPVVLVAAWKGNEYKVTLNANGGTVGSGDVDSYVHGTAQPLPADVSREGYTFEGWYASPDFTGSPVTEVGVDAIGDKVFYARWFSQAVEPTSVTVNGTSGVLGENDVYVVLPYGTPELPTDPSALDVTLPAGATMTDPVTTDGGKTWTFTVTSESGKVVRDYAVHVSIAPDPLAQEKADLAGAVSTIQAQPTVYWTVDQAQAPTQDATKQWVMGQLAKLPLNGCDYDAVLNSWQGAHAGKADSPAGTDGSFTFTVKLTKDGPDGNPLEAQTFVIKGVIKATPYAAGSGSGAGTDGTGGAGANGTKPGAGVVDAGSGRTDGNATHDGARVVPVNGAKADVAATGDAENPAEKGLMAGAVAAVAATFWAVFGRRKDHGRDEA